jgi:hypothetical protein
MEENVTLNNIEDAAGSDDHILEKNDYTTQIMEHVDFPSKNELQMQLKRKLDVIEEKINKKSENPKKKSRVSKDVSFNLYPVLLEIVEIATKFLK